MISDAVGDGQQEDQQQRQQEGVGRLRQYDHLVRRSAEQQRGQQPVSSTKPQAKAHPALPSRADQPNAPAAA